MGGTGKTTKIHSKKANPTNGRVAASSKEILAQAAKVSVTKGKKPVDSEDDDSSAMSSSKESSSEESDDNAEMAPAPAKKSTTKVNKILHPQDDESSSSSSEESSSEDSDGDTKMASVPAKTSPAKANKKSDTEDEDSSAESSSDESSSEDNNDDAQKASVPAKTSVKAKKTTATEDGDSSAESSSDESSSEDNGGDAQKMSAPVKTSPTKAKKMSNTKDEDSPAASSSEESSSEDDSGEGDDKASAPAQAVLPQANKKRKTDSETPAPPKKAKVSNGVADVSTSNEETKSIFVGRLSWNVDNDWLAQEFAECGEVESAHVQMDRNTGRSRGFGYVHFTTTDAVEKAIAMDGKQIDGRAVKVDKSNPPDKKASAERRAQAFGDTTSPPSAVLFVGNLSFGANEDTLWETFGEHGDIKNVRVPTDRETGRPKGFAYVEFSEVGPAKKAHAALQGFELDGRAIRLDFSQPRDGAGGRGGGQASRGGRGRGGFGGDRGRGGSRGGRGGDRGMRGRGRGARTGGITPFEGKKITFG